MKQGGDLKNGDRERNGIWESFRLDLLGVQSCDQGSIFWGDGTGATFDSHVALKLQPPGVFKNGAAVVFVVLCVPVVCRAVGSSLRCAPGYQNGNGSIWYTN